MKKATDEQKNIKIIKSKKLKKRIFLLIWVIVFVFVIYFAVQVIIIMMPRMRTEVAIQETMIDSLEMQGLVEIESRPVLMPQGTKGVLYYSVQTGQRVSAGTEVAQLFQSNDVVDDVMISQKIENELELLEIASQTSSENGDVEVMLKQIQDGLHSYIDVADSQDYSLLAKPIEEITFSSNRLQIATGASADFGARVLQLKELQKQYQDKIVQIGSIAAEETGYFVPAAKQDRVHANSETIAKMSPAQLLNELEMPPEFYSKEVVGHVATDFKWRFVGVVPLELSQGLPIGKKLEISFMEHDISELPVVVEDVTIDEENGLSKISFLCEYMNPAVLALRQETAQIIFGEKKGLRIDKEALRIIEGNKCVYVKFGNQAFARKIKILLEDENYMLISKDFEEDVNEVSMYDDVIVDAGGVELYDEKVL